MRDLFAKFIKPNCIAAVLLVLIAGCQQSQQKQTAEISRKDRLVGNENLGLRNTLTQCQQEIENQKKLVEQCGKEKEKLKQQIDENAKLFAEKEKKSAQQCEQEKEKIVNDTSDSSKWIMEQLPQNLLEDNLKLTEENAKLKAKIKELQKELEITEPNQLQL